MTELKHGVSAFKWSPDGSALLLKAEAPDDKEEQLDAKAKDEPALPEEKIVDRITLQSRRRRFAKRPQIAFIRIRHRGRKQRPDNVGRV
ncbi:hypothetical protein VQ056_28310 [Paenibacillus sp. JTLBN-2024]